MASLSPVLDDTDMDWEIFFVDDGSDDGSFAAIRELHRSNRRIRGCRLRENRGQQNALFCGLVSSSGRYLITMDDDGQHPVREIPVLLKILKSGYDVVYAVNRDPHRNRILRWGTALTGLFFTLFCGKPGSVEIGSYRCLTREMVDRFSRVQGDFVYVSALIFRSRPSPSAYSYRYHPDPVLLIPGSRFSFFRRFSVFLKLFLHYGPFRSFCRKKRKPFHIGEIL